MRFSRGGTFFLVALACLVGAGGASAQEVCEQLGAAHGDPALADAAGAASVQLFGVEDADAVVRFFQEHRVAVADVSDIVAGDGVWQARLGYTSLNASADGGSTVLFPHEATILLTAVSGPTTRLAERDVLLVFEVVEDREFTYSWIGCALPTTGVSLDWFVDKPEFLFRGAGEDDRR
jgi:hypothetical protein